MEIPQGQFSAANNSVKMYHRIAVLFIVLTAAVVGLAAYVVFARAQVVVMAERLPVESEMVIDVARDPGEGEVGGEVFEASDSLTRSFPSESVVKVDAHVEGRVRIASALPRSQTLIATTRLLTPEEVLFRIKETVVVPANGAVEVDVFADAAGTIGEVGAATFTIPGLRPETRKFFTVTAAAPFTGGVKDVRMVTRSDVEHAKETLKEKLKETLVPKLREQANLRAAGYDGEVVTVEVSDWATDQAVGSEAPEFSLTVRVQARGVFLDRKAFDAAVRKHLEGKIPYDNVLAEAGDTLAEGKIEKMDAAEGTANIRVRAAGKRTISPQSPELHPSRITGISTDAAKTYLEQVDGVSSASVRATPFWSGRMPNIADHIAVEVR